mgnify:CR=1 FL=1
MEYGQQMQQARDNALVGLYQNPGYHFERREKRTIVLDVVDDDTTMGTTPLTVAGNEFNVKLHEPLRIDRLSDVYLDSFITFDAAANNTSGADGKSAFVLSINEFNIQSNSNSSNIFNKVIIFNNADALDKAVLHKSKKFNYICSINPSTLTQLSGNITFLDGTNPFATTAKARFIAEFMIVARD